MWLVVGGRCVLCQFSWLLVADSLGVFDWLFGVSFGEGAAVDCWFQCWSLFVEKLYSSVELVVFSFGQSNCVAWYTRLLSVELINVLLLLAWSWV